MPDDDDGMPLLFEAASKADRAARINELNSFIGSFTGVLESALIDNGGLTVNEVLALLLVALKKRNAELEKENSDDRAG